MKVGRMKLKIAAMSLSTGEPHEYGAQMVPALADEGNEWDELPRVDELREHLFLRL